VTGRKGAQLAVVSGDPSGNGPYVVRAKLPPDYRIAAHHHPTAEYVTVLSGNFHLGMGDKLEPGKGQELRASQELSATASYYRPGRSNFDRYAATSANVSYSIR
jgi:anti-sigma factor ChrR (cupin superfamily)